MNFLSNTKARQNGASVVEAIVALFIFSIGALGLAALQLTSLVSSGESQQRSVVMWKAQEFADRIRANRSAVGDYIDLVNNSSLDTLGVDSDVGVITCEATTGFTKPNTICGDTEDANGASCTNVDDVVAYDVWDVFCNPNGGLATVAGIEADDFTQDGSAGVSRLEVVLRQNRVASGDPNDDVLLVLEWLSREAEANTDIAVSSTISADLCDIPNLNIASSLNVYCVRFSL